MHRFEYKALKFSAEGWFLGGKINAEGLESGLNEMAGQGWRLVTIITSNMAGGDTRDVVAVFERERTA